MTINPTIVNNIFKKELCIISYVVQNQKSMYEAQPAKYKDSKEISNFSKYSLFINNFQT